MDVPGTSSAFNVCKSRIHLLLYILMLRLGTCAVYGFDQPAFIQQNILSVMGRARSYTHIVHELRHILFGRTLALVVPVYIAMELCSICQNV